MAQRARMAACAHALDQILSRSVASSGAACRRDRHSRSREAGAYGVAQLCRFEPRHDGLDVGGQVMGGGIKPGMGISLETSPLAADTEITGPLAADTAITGPLAAVLWVSSSSEDMDLFLTLRNFAPDGSEVMETGQQGSPVPVAKGWLRVSHRELDPELSRPYRPYHRHLRRLYLAPGEVVRV